MMENCSMRIDGFTKDNTSLLSQRNMDKKGVQIERERGRGEREREREGGREREREREREGEGGGERESESVYYNIFPSYAM